MSKAGEREVQKRLEAASVHKRGDRVRAVRDMLDLHRSRLDVDDDFQARLKIGTLWVVVGYEAAWPAPHYRLQLLDDDGSVTDWWLVAPGSYLEAAPVRADELSGVDRFMHRLFADHK